ncbi:hypothetical protein [Sphingobium chungbukense]|uniref:hypothetical protein n=1 Tax=Sphingobium chungbukense TaxID=56193 RepID=UPI0012ED978F|nr:hypothetical protein [Sphingobium chungbukense]
MSSLPRRKVGRASLSAIELRRMSPYRAYLPKAEPADAGRLLLHAFDLGVTFRYGSAPWLWRP